MIKNLLKLYSSNKDQTYVILTQVINAIIALVSGKLIALYILPKDFGAYNIQFATYSLVTAFFINPFVQFVKSTNNSLLTRIGSKFYVYTFLGLILVGYTFLVSALYFIYDITDLKLYLILFCFLFLIGVYSIYSDFFMVKSKLVIFSKFSVFKGLAGLSFFGIFVYFSLDWLTSVELLWYMQIIGIIVALSLFYKNYLFFKSKLLVSYSSFFKRYIKFALPLVFLAFWAWINNFFDRYALEYFLSLNDVGVYNANYGVGSKFFILLSPIFMITMTPKVYALVKPAVKKGIIIKYFKYYSIIGIILLSIIFFTKSFIGNMLLSQTYQEGFFIIFWIALAFFILTLIHLFESIFYSENKTKIILYANIVSAIVNITANIIFIPLYGLIGAAIATVIGFLIQFIVVIYNFNKI